MEVFAPIQAVAGRLIFTAGSAFTTAVVLALYEQPFALTVNEMVFEPDDDQLTACGPMPVAVAGLAAVPKFHE